MIVYKGMCLKMFDDEIQYQIHFNECWDETLFLTEAEINDWLDEMYYLIKSKDYTPQFKLQKIVDSITNFE